MMPIDQTKRILEEWDVVLTTRDQLQVLISELMAVRQALWDGDRLGALARLEPVIDALAAHISKDKSAQ